MSFGVRGNHKHDRKYPVCEVLVRMAKSVA